MDPKRQRSVEDFWNWQFTLAPARILCLTVLSIASGVSAQLAITEVMSQASTNRGATLVISKSDFWELTNFGTNSISLDGYSFSDRDSDPSARVPDPFRKCIIGPGESIVLLRTDTITNRQDFLNWWGANNVPASLQVRSYPKTPGFDAVVDAVQLFNPSGQLVDRVDFGRALRGHTFVNDAATGEFGAFSAAGVGGAVRAVLADDIGSPGTTTGPVPLSILEQPVSTTQDAGLDAEFSVRAAGLPRPTYQWFFDGVAISGARKSSLVVSSVQPHNAGSFTVRISNGLMSMTSAPAALIVNTNPAPPSILIAPSDAIVFEGQAAVFSVKTRGYPPPTFQWQTNGANVPSATNSSITVSPATLPMSGRIYTVRVQNAHGSTNASARLTVTKPPKLAITEVMASVAGGSASGHTDWFELTNLDTNAVNLLGYRFSDRYSFDLVFQITNTIVIRPGESVIFTERMTPEEFIAWWGVERLPPGVQISTYYGLGLSSDGDVLNFWNSAETDPYSPVTSAAFVRSLVGVSLRFIPPDFYFVADSVAGRNGAFRAVIEGDIGSPGYVDNPRPRFLSMTRDYPDLVFKCRVVEGKTYALGAKAQISDPYWNTIGTYPANDFVMTLVRSSVSTQQFFILTEAP